MVVRSSAAICGAAILFVVSSAAMARTKIGKAHSHVVVANTTSGTSVFGAASMYNPFKPGYREGGPGTSTGERYDPFAWSAAIQTDLRGKFGGVHHGTSPKYALVEGRGRKAIVKINDVGPLKPGRVIDLNERTMRYFDPGLQMGVIPGVKVTPLAGKDWTPGPVAENETPEPVAQN